MGMRQKEVRTKGKLYPRHKILVTPLSLITKRCKPWSH